MNKYLLILLLVLIIFSQKSLIAVSYSTGFESPNYSTGALVGQDGWTNTSGSVYNVQSNDGSVIGVNPIGNAQFSLSQSTGLSRVQNQIPVLGNLLHISYDVYLGTGNQNATNAMRLLSLGSSSTFSPSAMASGVSYDPVNNVWNFGFTGSDGLLYSFDVPLVMDAWYKVDYVVDFTTAHILSASTQCIAGQLACGGNTDPFNYDFSFLTLSTTGIPTTLFLTQNGIVIGTVGYDNINIVAVPAPATYLTLSGFLGLALLVGCKKRCIC